MRRFVEKLELPSKLNELKGQLAGLIAQRTDGIWGLKVLERRLSVETGKRSDTLGAAAQDRGLPNPTA
ncbi:jg7283 [Pararge aegeria aegeria]|uniref:Jg7283 protein n=1 Tax=Pararge aegeria aegeria TaxID=348720 RepID=A0A8S4SBQ9_9NEOP|nr:jg7283 [Pararge aegeria aegeria]